MQIFQDLSARASKLIEAGEFEQAEQLARQALAVDPNCSAALHILGVVARQTGRNELAIETLQKAAALDPGHPGIHFELGASLHQAHRLGEAVISFHRATELKPEFQEAYVNLGALLDRLDQPDQGLLACQTAVRLQPDCYIARFNLGNLLRSIGRLDEAAAEFRETIRLQPDFAKAHWNLACCALLAGDFRTGWEEYEWREAAGEVAIDRYQQPHWQGESLTGKHLLVHAEQGIGDEILFASCWPDLIPQAKRCVIVCDPRLEQLFIRSFPTAVVHGSVRRKDRAPANVQGRIDFQTPAGSVPRLLRTSMDHFPRRRQFLIADPVARRLWQLRYEQLGRGLKVGISWQAGGQPAERHKRTMPLTAWECILRTPGAHFINLQYGDTTDELEDVRQRFGIELHDWPDADPLLDLDAFAAKVAALDLVISVGNATVHMAGALGVPTWNLLPLVPAWRWMITGEQSIWYPSVRLFRQQQRGKWQPVLKQVEQDLAELVEARGFAHSSAANCQQKFSKVIARSVVPGLDSPPTKLSRLSDVPELIERARDAFRERNYQRAEALCRDLLNHAPRNVVALRLLGLVARNTGRPELAVRMLGRAIAIQAGDPQLHFQLASAMCDAGQTGNAVEHFSQAAKLDPADPHILLALGQAQWSLRRVAEAKCAFASAVDIDPRFAKAWNGLGVSQMALGQIAPAEASLRSAVEIQPDYLAAWNNLGSLLQQLGRSAEAIECFRHVLRIDPTFAQAKVSLASLEAKESPATSTFSTASQFRVDAAHQPHGNSLQPLTPAENETSSAV